MALLTRDEKKRAAVVSVSAAIILTLAKLLVGLATGSLGMLSEAAHSGLDLIASLITFLSVRIAEAPADSEHPYGHGRFENLSAVVQSILLTFTALFIIYESIQRIFINEALVEPNALAFIVMGLSVAIDYWRSGMLARVAKKYHSQALEADALNFRADMFSSLVVILGLAITSYAQTYVGVNSFLYKADAVAAAIVALFIMFMSVRLGLKGIKVLLDTVPSDLQTRMTEAAASVPGVLRSQPVRLRESGDRLFADVVVTVPRTITLSEAHDITERVEESLRQVEPRTEAVVHVEPGATDQETVLDNIRAIAQQMGIRTHHEEVHQVDGGLEASLHIEVPPDLTLRDAHSLAHRLVSALRQETPSLLRVDTHIEVISESPGERVEIKQSDMDLKRKLKLLAENAVPGCLCKEVRVYRSGEGLQVVLHCQFPGDLSISNVHLDTEKIEHVVRDEIGEAAKVIVHAEPD